jgi:hypothetical protein
MQAARRGLAGKQPVGLDSTGLRIRLCRILASTGKDRRAAGAGLVDSLANPTLKPQGHGPWLDEGMADLASIAFPNAWLMAVGRILQRRAFQHT